MRWGNGACPSGEQWRNPQARQSGGAWRRGEGLAGAEEEGRLWEGSEAPGKDAEVSSPPMHLPLGARHPPTHRGDGGDLPQRVPPGPAWQAEVGGCSEGTCLPSRPLLTGPQL